jgi:drug/metabolite transporter (DMT)-like permease
MVTAAAMLCGGLLLLLTGTANGEWAAFKPSTFSIRSALAVGYLIVFGSLITYSAYVWLLRVSTPAKVSTTAYVNPVVAVLLGWLLGGEGLSSRTLVATVIVIASVVLITAARLRQRDTPRIVRPSSLEPPTGRSLP